MLSAVCDEHLVHSACLVYVHAYMISCSELLSIKSSLMAGACRSPDGSTVQATWPNSHKSQHNKALSRSKSSYSGVSRSKLARVSSINNPNGDLDEGEDELNVLENLDLEERVEQFESPMTGSQASERISISRMVGGLDYPSGRIVGCRNGLAEDPQDWLEDGFDIEEDESVSRCISCSV